MGLKWGFGRQLTVLALCGFGFTMARAAQPGPGSSAAAGDTPPRPEQPVHRCVQWSACPGIKLDHQRFSLLTGNPAAASASILPWGEYLKLLLIITNRGVDPVNFNPATVQLHDNKGQRHALADVRLVTTPGTGVGFGFGMNNRPGGNDVPVYAPVGSVVWRAMDPYGPSGELSELRGLERHKKQLKQLLRRHLGPAQIPPGGTLAGFVILHALPAGVSPARASFTIGKERFILPLAR